ncbi:hypothetical protein ACRRTK_003951 [Alexandromys fortis]
MHLWRNYCVLVLSNPYSKQSRHEIPGSHVNKRLHWSHFPGPSLVFPFPCSLDTLCGTSPERGLSDPYCALPLQASRRRLPPVQTHPKLAEQSQVLHLQESLIGILP